MGIAETWTIRRDGNEPAKHIRGGLPFGSAFTVVVFILICLVDNFFRNDFLSLVGGSPFNSMEEFDIQ